MKAMRPVLGITAVLLLAACAGPAEPDEPAAAGPTAHGSHSGPPPAAAPLREHERFVDVTMPRAYRPAAPNGGTDEYRCFLVDPGLTEPAFLTGSRFRPQNADVVHHAIFYRLSPEQAGDAEALDARTAGDGWTCFGDTGLAGQTAWVAHWAPGAGETLMPAGFGFEMPPGSKLVMQVHYNLLGIDKQAETTDRSGMQMRLADGTAPLRPLATELAVAPIELPCEPGGTGPLCDREAAVADVAKRFGPQSRGFVEELRQQCRPVPGPTQHCDRPVGRSGTIHMAGGHMHLLGRSIKVEVNPGTPAARTVVDVPEYNFDNQALTPLAEPVTVERGDTIRVTCTHDATLRTKLPQLRSLPSRYVVWGEGTSDEMCLGVMVFAPKS